jgi:hypothetical protein
LPLSSFLTRLSVPFFRTSAAFPYCDAVSRGEGWGEGKDGGEYEETEKNESLEGSLEKEKY